MVDKAKIGFKAIAVVAAINLSGEVVEVLIRENSICHPDFEAFLNALRTKMRSRKTYIFVDNLRIHHMLSTRDRARQNN